ncbi:MAG: hypothetical protein Fur005_15260 [Roseiflexaceae bacterium]
MVRQWGVERLWFLVAVAVVGAMGLAIARAQSQTCRDVSNITICGDTFTEFDSTTNGGGFRLRGNLRIGPKGLPAVVAVDNIGNIFDGSVLAENVTAASYFHFNQADSNTGTTDFIIGDVRLLSDPTGLGLMRSGVVPVPNGSGEVRVGRLFVDPVNRKIFNPAAGAVPIFVQDGITRNANITLAFISRVGALSFYRDGGSVNELALVNGEFDLTAKTFKGTVPIDLKLNQQAENPNLRITMRATFSDGGNFTGTIDGFKMSLAGLLMDAAGLTFTPATSTASASFKAATIKVLKADNQDVPTLDPTDPTVIFTFTNLVYKDNKFEIGGGEVGVKDWEFGNAFKMTSQTLGIVNANNVQSLQIKSTLNFFGDSADPKRKVPIILSIGRSETSPGVFKPVFSAGLQNIEPKIGTMTFKLQGAVFSGSAAENFWGIKATTAALQWPAYLGGQTAAGISNFKIGVELDASKNKKFKVALGNGTITLPPFENQAFQGTLGATVGVVNETMVITGTGTFALKIPNSGNSAGVATQAILRYGKTITSNTPTTPSTTPTNCRRGGLFVPCPDPGVPPPSTTAATKELELKLAGFSFKLAGFGLTVTNPRGLDDGGFAADNVAARLPAGVIFENIGSGADTNGFTIQGLAYSGSGNVTIQGGSFEIAPIKFGSYQFVGLKGTFVKQTTGGFEFKAGGKLPLPGIEPGANGGGISAEVRIFTKPDNSVDGFGVTVVFTAGGAIPKIKLPGTGMSITSMSGSFDIRSGQSTIAVGLTATSDLAIPLGSLGSLPIAKATGTVSIQPPPTFKMTANATLSILIFQVAQASVGIGQSYGFNGGPGLDVTFTVNTLFIDGSAHLKVGEVTLNNGTKKIRVQGDATLTVLVPEKIFAGLPREDKILASVTVGFGQYTDTRNNNRQSAGILAMGTLALVGTVGGFLDMGAQPVDVIFFKDPGRFVAVTAADLQARAAAGVPGYSSRRLSVAETLNTGLRGLGPQSTIQQDATSYTLDSPTRLLMGIEYTGTLGLAQIRLRLPSGTILTQGSVNGTTETFANESDAEGGVLMFILQNAPAGTYQLLIDNPPAQYTANTLELDQIPTGSISAESCAGPAIGSVTMTCNGSGSSLSQISFNWSAADIDTPDATVDVGYVKVISGTIDNTTFTPLQSGLALGSGSATVSFGEVPTGTYRAMVEITNSSGPAVRLYGNQLIQITDQRAPAVPTGITATSLPNELSVTWTQNSERDLAGYEIGLGVVETGQADSTANFFYTRSMGPKDVIANTSNLVDGKLWGIPDNVEVFFALRSYDHSGNYSAWSAIQRGKPWALSPNTWTPVPSGTGDQLIEIAFDTPMDADTFTGALTVKDASGNTIAGTTYLLTNDAETEIIGIGFDPDGLLVGSYTATLKGGSAGVEALDGRTMNSDYSWSFTLEGYRILLPMVVGQ